MTCASSALFCDLFLINEIIKQRGVWNLDFSPPRTAGLIIIPASLVINTLDTLVGTLQGIASIPFDNYDVSNYANANLKGAENLLAQPFQYLINAINPDALKERSAFRPLSLLVDEFLQEQAQKMAVSKNGFNHHITSRLVHSLRFLAAVVMRAVEFVFGVSFAVAAFLTLGRFNYINQTAYVCLKAPGLIKDIIVISREIFYPPKYLTKSENL